MKTQTNSSKSAQMPFNAIWSKSKSLEDNHIDDVKCFVNDLLEGKPHQSYSTAFLRSEVYHSLNLLKEKFYGISESKKKEEWINGGILGIANVLSSSKNSTNLCEQSLKFLARYVAAQRAAIYTVTEDEQELECVSMYAGNIGNKSSRVSISNGVVGECYNRNELIVMRHVPPEYFQITSALGAASAKNILFVPISLSGLVLGVIELATLYEYSEDQTDFLKLAAERLGAQLYVFKTVERTQNLLASNNVISDMLRRKEQELTELVELLRQQQIDLVKKNEELEISKRRIIEIQEEEKILTESKLAAEEVSHSLIVAKLKAKIKSLEYNNTNAYDAKTN